MPAPYTRDEQETAAAAMDVRDALSALADHMRGENWHFSTDEQMRTLYARVERAWTELNAATFHAATIMAGPIEDGPIARPIDNRHFPTGEQ